MTALWDGTSRPYAEGVWPGTRGFLRASCRIEVDSGWQGRSQHADRIDEMLDALQEGRAAETDCHDNIKSIAMLLAAIESADSGRKVAIELD